MLYAYIVTLAHLWPVKQTRPRRVAKLYNRVIVGHPDGTLTYGHD